MKGLKYDVTIKNNKEVYNENPIIRKNYMNFTDAENKYLKNLMNSIDMNKLKVIPHALKDGFLSAGQLLNIVRNKKTKIIDYQLFTNNNEERILIRTKDKFEVTNKEGKKVKVYIKIVISVTKNRVISTWCNTCKDEIEKQKTLVNGYYPNFDIINRKVRL